jgi:hypothetical protein
MLTITPANLNEAYLTIIRGQRTSPTGTQRFYNIYASQSTIIGRSQVYYFYSIGNSNVHKRKRIIAEMSMKFRSIGATRLTVPKLVLYGTRNGRIFLIGSGLDGLSDRGAVAEKKGS